MIHRVSKDDSADLGFAWSSLLAGAIDMAEFKAWVERVVVDTPAEVLPPFMIELMMAEDRRDLTVGLRDIIGFWPSDPDLGADERSAALSGLAALRGRDRSEDTGRTPAASIAILHKHPSVAARFATVFPDIALPELE